MIQQVESSSTMAQPGEDDLDVIIVGGGIMGSCIAYEVAKRGRKALLLEQFDFLHFRGSSHGESRTIRATYPQSYYAAMVLESARLWEQAQAEMGYRVYTKTSQFDMGPSHDRGLLSVIGSCRSRGIPHTVLDPRQVREKFGGVFQLPDGWIGVSTEVGGIIKPTKAVSMFQALAFRHGARLMDQEEVVDVKKDGESGGVLVYTASGKVFSASKCVVTAGAWMRKLVKTVTAGTLELPIQPLQTTVCYWKIAEGSEGDFVPEAGFPTFSSYGEPHIFGTPSFEFPGLIKVMIHGGYPCDPDQRSWATDMGLVEKVISPWIEGRFAGRVESGSPAITQSCMYSMTPDGDFVIDFLGGEFGEHVVVAGGFSGHGFKMGPVVGRIVADLALYGTTEGVELEHFRLGRFQGNPLGNAKEATK